MKIAKSSSNIKICGPKSLRKRGPGRSCNALADAKAVSQKMRRLVEGLHQACDAKCAGRQSSGRLESRCAMRGRPQKGATCCGRQTICTVKGGQGQGGEIVSSGVCEMRIWDDSWCRLTPLEMKTRAGVGLMVMAVCWSRKCEEYVCVTSRMVDEVGK